MRTSIFLLCCTLCISTIGLAQHSTITPVGSVHIDKQLLPANLNIVENSIQFMDATGDNTINANEACSIRFTIRNTGRGAAYGCTAKISYSGTMQDIKINAGQKQEAQQLIEVPTIKAGEEKTITIPLLAGMNTKDGVANFTIQVDEPNGFGTDPSYLSVNTRAYIAPRIRVTDYSVTSQNGTTLQKKQPFDLQVLVQNTTHGLGEDVQMEIIIPENIIITEGNKQEHVGTMKGGVVKSYTYGLIATNNYTGTTIPVQIRLREKYGRYAESRSIDLHINQTFASTKINVPAEEQVREDITIASLTSKVDKNIPQGNTRNSKTFAVIIANEQYRQVANVPYAMNDGNIFRQYCETTLGIPAQNIHFATNATPNEMKSHINWLNGVIQAYGNEAKIIFYYVGHGIPSESDKSAYLLPADGNGTDVTTGYKLEDLYAALGKHRGNSIVFLDACFSGAKREGDMLLSARGIAIKVKDTAPQGNMVVFSAATGDETAYPYNDEHHGLFTYYLLEKLQSTSGNVTLQELADYIKTNVSRTAIVVNNKSQTPTITPSVNATGWQNWKLK